MSCIKPRFTPPSPLSLATVLGTYCSVVLTIPRHLNFHRFDQIKVARDKILRSFIETVEIKVVRYQIGGNLGGVEQ